MSQIATIIRNATIVNEGVSFHADLLIENNVISKISKTQEEESKL
jgi:dihydroorotase-like cyclic amidohydrolase